MRPSRIHAYTDTRTRIHANTPSPTAEPYLANCQAPPAVLPTAESPPVRLGAWRPPRATSDQPQPVSHRPTVHVHQPSNRPAGTAARRHRLPVATRHQRPAQQPVAGTARHSPVPGSRASPVALARSRPSPVCHCHLPAASPAVCSRHGSPLASFRIQFFRLNRKPNRNIRLTEDSVFDFSKKVSVTVSRN
jgi:hypothetical protein